MFSFWQSLHSYEYKRPISLDFAFHVHLYLHSFCSSVNHQSLFHVVETLFCYVWFWFCFVVFTLLIFFFIRSLRLNCAMFLCYFFPFFLYLPPFLFLSFHFCVIEFAIGCYNLFFGSFLAYISTHLTASNTLIHNGRYFIRGSQKGHRVSFLLFSLLFRFQFIYFSFMSGQCNIKSTYIKCFTNKKRLKMG